VSAIALVTGASSGFGLLASLELARRGLRVFASMRDLGRATALREAAAAAGVGVETVALDVTRPETIDAAFRTIADRAGEVEVLVNNAGFGMGGTVEDLSMDELRAQMETNFFGLVAVTRAALPGMRRLGRGRIIQISSISGRIGTPGLGAYVASKFAVEGLSEALRLEVAPFGIKIVLIEPGVYRTSIWDSRQAAAGALLPTSAYRAFSQRFASLIDRAVARSTADPREVARLIAKAATARRPRFRYVAGRDARLTLLLHRLSPALLRALLARVYRFKP